MPNVWGIHNDTLTTELLEGGFVSVSWDGLPDLSTIAGGREGLKAALEADDPDAKKQAIANWAGVLLRFRDEMQVGDVVVAPYRPDSTINIGRIIGPYEYHPDEATHRHHRRVEWVQAGLSRTVFTQSALYELGSVLTTFRIRRHADEFLAAIELAGEPDEVVTKVIDEVAEDTDEQIDEPRASRIERHTRDFVLDRLATSLTHEEFEQFTADLQRTLGYQARVTQYSQDGGVDVIAHRDPLGIEPPQIKVQCKHRVGSTGAPEVQQLIGTQAPGEFCLFVTLGAYTKDALAIERQRAALRLLSGEDVVALVLENYAKLPERWKAVFPLTSVLTVADGVE